MYNLYILGKLYNNGVYVNVLNNAVVKRTTPTAHSPTNANNILTNKTATIAVTLPIAENVLNGVMCEKRIKFKWNENNNMPIVKRHKTKQNKHYKQPVTMVIKGVNIVVNRNITESRTGTTFDNITSTINPSLTIINISTSKTDIAICGEITAIKLEI